MTNFSSNNQSDFRCLSPISIYLLSLSMSQFPKINRSITIYLWSNFSINQSMTKSSTPKFWAGPPTNVILGCVDAVCGFVDGVVDGDVGGLHELPQHRLSILHLPRIHWIPAHPARNHRHATCACKRRKKANMQVKIWSQAGILSLITPTIALLAHPVNSWATNWIEGILFANGKLLAALLFIMKINRII